MKKINWKQKVSKKIILIVAISFLIFAIAFAAFVEIKEGKRIVAGDIAEKGKIDLRSSGTSAGTDKSWAGSLADKSTITVNGKSVERKFSKDKCKKIQLAASASNDVFVPFKYQPEWESFLTAQRAGNIPGLTLSNCCAGFGEDFSKREEPIFAPDHSSARNDNGGFYNSENYSNVDAFAALKSDGSIKAWGSSSYGGSSPSGTDFTKIYSTYGAFAALKSDGSIKAWGHSSYGGGTPPSGTGFTKIYSTDLAFAALKSHGSITAWGNSSNGGSALSGTGFTKIYSTRYAFAALIQRIDAFSSLQ